MRSLLLNDVATARRILTRPDMDFVAMCGLLEKSRLAGYLFTLITDTEWVALFPPWALDRLAASYQRQVAKNTANLALLRQLVILFREVSIPFVTLKGLYLAQHFFGDIRRRFMSDVDILVRSDDLEAALAGVARLGLYPAAGIRVDPHNPAWGIHAVEVRGQAGTLDIHHAIRNLPNIHFDYDSLWDNATEFTVGDTSLFSLCATDTLLIAAVGLGADIQNSHHSLRKIWDIYMMLRQLDKSVDWANFFAVRQREGSLKLVLNVFAFCLLLLDAQDDCPAVLEAMSAHERLILIKSAETAERIFLRKRQNLANRLLFSRLLPVSPLFYWLRWLITLPVRVWHYRRAMPLK
jgi:hypothetical protein